MSDTTLDDPEAEEGMTAVSAVHIPLDDEPASEVIDLRDVPPDPSSVAEAAVAPTVDRFEARRRRVERTARRRRLRRLGAVVAAVALVALVWAAFSTPWLTLQQLDIHPGTRMGVNEIEAAAGVSTGDRLLTLDTGAVERRLEASPWVERASVAVRWPTTLRIRIVERRPIGVAVGGGAPAMAVVDGGVVAGPVGPADAEVVPLDLGSAPRWGRRLPAAAVEAVTAVGALPRTVAAEVSGARLTLLGGIELDLRRGGVVVFGPPEQLEAKYAALEAILGGEVDLRGLRRLDVSVPSAPTITR